MQPLQFCVVNLHILSFSFSSLSLSLSQERQNVVGEWIEEKTEPGASPDAGNNPVDFLLQISHIQRLKVTCMAFFYVVVVLLYL